MTDAITSVLHTPQDELFPALGTITHSEKENIIRSLERDFGISIDGKMARAWKHYAEIRKYLMDTLLDKK